MNWPIAEVARMSGVTARTLRHYDEAPGKRGSPSLSGFPLRPSAPEAPPALPTPRRPAVRRSVRRPVRSRAL
ncbi:MerR family DNA-binding transcriptional regulator [Streptomyces sp. NPDC005485]|uniref:MerR family DNA-binding transcriptional regulator n=1 Tax=Streptomyces sp. NPDC005485 TaxID=3155591 RepID=UPI0033B4E993